MKVDIPNIEDQFGSAEKIDSFIEFSINHRIVAFKECISYFLYIIYALSYINIKEDHTRFGISTAFFSVFEEYKDLIGEVKRPRNIWSEK
ncbi:hypothetical protein D3C74_475430 [compost metagenome]